ncbi:MAG: SRPBCC domain-containing protein [Flavobacteriales bacterium]|nr:SRPBCC domain-containing protein [Flavobacteriales bacterium]
MTDDPNAALQIVSARTFHHPQERVYMAWTAPEILQMWWGPKGFTNTFHEHDLRPGGHWLFTMHGPDKGHYENHAVFDRIESPTFLSWHRLSPPLFRVEATFEATAAQQTHVVFKMLFDDAKLCATIKAFAVDKNEENFDRLEGVLEGMKGV